MNLRDLFRRKPQPDLINLIDYEAELSRQRERMTILRTILCPPRPIPDRQDRNWTQDEMAAMEENRRLASEIYHKVTTPLRLK
jgi:hypothetical protein